MKTSPKLARHCLPKVGDKWTHFDGRTLTIVKVLTAQLSGDVELVILQDARGERKLKGGLEYARQAACTFEAGLEFTPVP